MARLLRNCTITALLISTLISTGCRTDEAIRGYLAFSFQDGEFIARPIIISPPEEGEYRLYYALELEDRVCVLRGQIPAPGLFSIYSRCENLTGSGMLACNNGHSLNLQWEMTSCQGGHGRSIEFAGSSFHFGFEATEEGSISQLRRAQREEKEPAKNRRANTPLQTRLSLQP